MIARIPRLGSSTIAATKQRSQPEVGCVYLITSPSRKQYVGQTVQALDLRWKGHVWEALNGSANCRALANAIRKYGADAFQVELLHECNDLDELNRLEATEIAQRGTLAPGGYNLRTGGDSSRHSDRTKALLSDIAKERCSDPTVRERQIAQLRAYYANTAALEAASQRSKARWANPATRKKMADKMKERCAEPSARKARSERSKARWADPAFRAAMVEQARQGGRAKHPNVFVEGRCFPSKVAAGQANGVSDVSVGNYVKSENPRWRWWHLIPNHNDPECDAVEECWAIMQWAEANPEHENVPAWMRRRA